MWQSTCCLVVVLRTRHVHGSQTAVYSVLYTAVYTGRIHTRPCTCVHDRGYTAIYMARTRPCTWRCTGRVRAVYTAVLLHGREHGRVHSPYTAVYGPRVQVYTARIHGIALSMAFDGRCIRFWSRPTLHVTSLLTRGMTLNWFQR